MGRAASILCAFAALVCGSCSPQRQSGEPEPVIAVENWPYVPATVRVHPLSRVVPGVDPGTPPHAEVCVQCLDVDGDPTRGVGLLSVQVGADADASTTSRNLGDAKVNRADWDPITRTYRLQFAVPAAFQCGSGAVLPVQVRLQLTPTRQLQASANIGCP